MVVHGTLNPLKGMKNSFECFLFITDEHHGHYLSVGSAMLFTVFIRGVCGNF